MALALSAPFTVGLDRAPTGNVTVTPRDSTSTGRFEPTSIVLTSAAPNATFRYVAGSAGATTVSVSAAAGANGNPSVGYTATASSSFGVLATAANGLSAGSWLDWTTSTNVQAVTDVSNTQHSPAGEALAWLESRAPGYYMTNWPGNLTWDVETKQAFCAGASQSTSGDSPVGAHSAVAYLDVTTGRFSKQWNPMGEQLWHVYDTNVSRPLNGYVYRKNGDASFLWRMRTTTRVWEKVIDLSPLALGTIPPAIEVHPGLGSAGSVIMVSNDGLTCRYDVASRSLSTLAGAKSLAGMGPAHMVASYHPAIASVVFGGGADRDGIFGTALYKLSASGAISLVTNQLPSGVRGISSASDSVLAPDPQGRAFAWLFDQVATRKLWRLNLSTGAWTDMGALPTNFALAAGAMPATIPELGIFLFFDGNARTSASVSGSRVWLYRPPA